jgi:hypothetical protein
VVEKGSTRKKGKKMKKEIKASKEIRSIDLANDELVAGLVSTLNESAQVQWFEKAVRMLANEQISIRGLKATIEKAQDSTWLKPSHVPYFEKASLLRCKAGAEKIALKKVITTIQDAKRAWKTADEFDSRLAAASSFKQFSDSIPARESKARGAGKQTSSEKGSDVPVALTMDEVIELTLATMEALPDNGRLISNFQNAEKLQRVLKSGIANSKAVIAKHASRVKVNA